MIKRERLLERMGTGASFLRLVVVTAAIVVLFGILTPSAFLSGTNLRFLASSAPELALLSLAVAVAMLTGGIDLSIVAVSNLGGIVTALVLRGSDGSTLRLMLGIGAGLAVATVAGVANGALVAGLRATPILATLGTSQLFAGLSLVLTEGSVIKGVPDSFSSISNATIVGVPATFVGLLVLAGVGSVLLHRTTTGFRLRLLGANQTAAHFTGFRTARLLILTYAVSGLLSGLAGLIIVSRASGADSTYGGSYLLLSIVVAVLAGVNPDGGYVTVGGVIVATLAMLVLSSGLLALRLNSYVVNIAQGALLIVMMTLNNHATFLSRRLSLTTVTRRPGTATKDDRQ